MPQTEFLAQEGADRPVLGAFRGEVAHRLAPGDLAIVDNRVSVHGRTAVQPRYDGRDRWLQRTFAFADLRCSREHRPDDGAVLTS